MTFLNCTAFIESNGIMNVSDEFEMVWKERATDYFQHINSLTFVWKPKENH